MFVCICATFVSINQQIPFSLLMNSDLIVCSFSALQHKTHFMRLRLHHSHCWLKTVEERTAGFLRSCALLDVMSPRSSIRVSHYRSPWQQMDEMIWPQCVEVEVRKAHTRQSAAFLHIQSSYDVTQASQTHTQHIQWRIQTFHPDIASFFCLVFNLRVCVCVYPPPPFSSGPLGSQAGGWDVQRSTSWRPVAPWQALPIHTLTHHTISLHWLSLCLCVCAATFHCDAGRLKGIYTWDQIIEEKKHLSCFHVHAVIKSSSTPICA